MGGFRGPDTGVPDTGRQPLSENLSVFVLSGPGFSSPIYPRSPLFEELYVELAGFFGGVRLIDEDPRPEDFAEYPPLEGAIHVVAFDVPEVLDAIFAIFSPNRFHYYSLPSRWECQHPHPGAAPNHHEH